MFSHHRNNIKFNNHRLKTFSSTSSSNEGEKAFLCAVDENKLGILSIDIGAPLIGMNSIRELGSFRDIQYEFAILSEIYTNYSKYSCPL